MKYSRKVKIAIKVLNSVFYVSRRIVKVLTSGYTYNTKIVIMQNGPFQNSIYVIDSEMGLSG